MTKPRSDIAFTPTVKALQIARGSRGMYEKREADGGFRTRVTQDLVDFLADIDTAYLATATADGQPYAQHRGGPRGFIRALDDRTLGLVDYRGNRQYISSGNLQDNPRAFLFLMDYRAGRRVKIWGTARMIPATPELMGRLMPAHYRAVPEQVLLFTVLSWDVNCPQHIPRMIDLADVVDEIRTLKARIGALEAENASLRTQSKAPEGESL